MTVALRPCRHCNGGETHLTGQGQIWRGVKGYSDPQFWQLVHFCKRLDPDDDFVTSRVEYRGRTEQSVADLWNSHHHHNPKGNTP